MLGDSEPVLQVANLRARLYWVHFHLNFLDDRSTLTLTTICSIIQRWTWGAASFVCWPLCSLYIVLLPGVASAPGSTSLPHVLLTSISVCTYGDTFGGKMADIPGLCWALAAATLDYLGTSVSSDSACTGSPQRQMGVKTKRQTCLPFHLQRYMC